MAIIQGSASSEPLLGTINNDTIYGAGGSDTIDGLAGTDTAVISSGRVFFTITNLSGAVRVTENGLAAFPYKYTTVRLLNVEKVQFSDLTETIFSTANKVMLSGYNYSSYKFIGTADNETIDGAGGDDWIDGGAGMDTAVFFGNRSDFKIVNLEGAVRITGLNTAPVEYRGYTAKLINTERVQFTDDLAPTNLYLTANKVILSGYYPFSNEFVGTADNETFDGAGGNDLIDGGAGTDTAVFFGNRNDFNITNLNGVIQVTGLNTAPSEYRGYTAQLTNVENVQFIDLKISQDGSVNNLPTGSVHINVTNPSTGQTLTAFNDLDDADGVGTITYQWKAGGVNIGVGQNYQVTANDVGKAITVTASYTDGFDHLESISSAPTASVTSVLPLPSAVNRFQSVLSAEEKTIIDSEKAGMIRVMADFSKAAYHLEPNENKLINDFSPNADAAVINPGWQPLNFDIPLDDGPFFYTNHSSESKEEVMLLNEMTNGLYHNGNAAAFVARVDDAIVISFRGTNDNGPDPDYIHPDKDQWGEIGSGGSMRDHYQLLKPLIDAVDNYVSTNNIGKVYVTGHSLGGAMAIEYMARPEHAGAKYQAITFAAPDFTKNNADRVSYADDSRIIQIEVSEDPVPQTWDVLIDQNRPGDVIRFAGNQTLDEPDPIGLKLGPIALFWANTANHSMDYYRQITDSVDAGSWVRILDDLDKRGDQTVFLGGRRDGDNFFVDEGGDTLTDTDLDQEDINHLGDDNIEIFYGGRGDDTLTGGGTKELLLGGSGNDKLYGNGDVDRLFGDAGNDTLDGGSGVDTLIGGLGDDTYVIDNAMDIITENPETPAGTKDHVNSYSNFYTLPANVENLTLKIPPLGASNGTGNVLANIITGNAVTNILNGAAGNDQLFGEGGNDRLFGKGGKDTLTGGAGADKFVFDTVAGTGNIDTITDFVSGTDKILLDDDIFTALGITGTAAGAALTAGKFHAGTSALDTLDRIVYNSSTGALYYDANGSVSGQNVQIALIGTTTHPALTASDFLVIA
ncbi:MAG TPA: hypothetical protein PKY67_07345 [Nitrosomonas sp.]|nr:hypothetical protein [Nitrosomonas sp.]